MPEPVMPPLPVEAQLQYEILRTEVRGTNDVESLRDKALTLIDLLELQRRTVNAMPKHGFCGTSPTLPRLSKPADV
jgi:hypothetical protein